MYGDGRTITDFLVVPPGGLVTRTELFLLDGDNKQLIQCRFDDHWEAYASVIPQDFLDGPRLLCPAWSNGELFILDKGGVNRIFPDDAATGYNYRPLPAGMTGDDVEDMILTQTADGPELVLITRKFGNFGMTPQTESEAAAAELSRILDAYLAGLPRRDRVIFLERYYGSRSLTEIGRLFGLSRSSVDKTLKRVRDGLREKLESEGFYP